MHSEFEIMLFVSGDATYVVENEKYELSPYSLILTRPTEYHFLSFKNDEKNYERFWLHFNLEEFPKEIAEKLLNGHKVIKIDQNNRISKILKHIEEYSLIFPPEKHHDFYQGLFVETVYLVSLETENNDDVIINEANEITAKILKYINEHITEPLSVESIAKALFISPSQLCHKFSQYMNVGVMKYVKKKRAFFADKMLKQGVKPTAVATFCGYGDYSSFYRAYKEVFKVPPTHRK
jgi:AraC-like DNA-binding protein